jgi:hypothetical protein
MPGAPGVGACWYTHNNRRESAPRSSRGEWSPRRSVSVTLVRCLAAAPTRALQREPANEQNPANGGSPDEV